jgi:hypothetical protein
MAVTLQEPVQVGPNAYRLTWSSELSDPVFRIYRNGVLVTQTRATSWVFHMPPKETHDIEIFDDAAEVSRGGRAPSVALQWVPVAGAEDYLVEQFITGEWTPVGVVQEVGATQNSLLIDALADVTTHDFRVTARNPRGASTPATVDFTLVRTPDAPEVSMTYDDGTKKVTVAAV